MRFDVRFVNYSIKHLIGLVCQIDYKELEKIPHHGPLIIVSNHINFIEVPLLYTHLAPRPITGFAKAEGWKNPFLRYLAKNWGAIPLHRGEADIAALKKAVNALQEGKIVGLAPEGTRSGDGKLGQGHPGVVFLALNSQAPILPVAFYGSENYIDDWFDLKKTKFNIKVGNPFLLINHQRRIDNWIRKKMVEEIMYQLSALLPVQNRGFYSDFENATENFLVFSAGSPSNLDRLRNN